MVKWVCRLSFRSQRPRTALLRAFEVWAKIFHNLEKVRLGSRHGPLNQEISHLFFVFVVGKKHKKMKCFALFLFLLWKKSTRHFCSGFFTSSLFFSNNIQFKKSFFNGKCKLSLGLMPSDCGILKYVTFSLLVTLFFLQLWPIPY